MYPNNTRWTITFTDRDEFNFYTDNSDLLASNIDDFDAENMVLTFTEEGNCQTVHGDIIYSGMEESCYKVEVEYNL